MGIVEHIFYSILKFIKTAQKIRLTIMTSDLQLHFVDTQMKPMTESLSISYMELHSKAVKEKQNGIIRKAL